MAISNYTDTDKAGCFSFCGRQVSLEDFRQRRGIGESQAIIAGREDQAVLVLRALIALADGCGVDSTVSDHLRMNLAELAVVARNLLCSPVDDGGGHG